MRRPKLHVGRAIEAVKGPHENGKITNKWTMEDGCQDAAQSDLGVLLGVMCML